MSPPVSRDGRKVVVAPHSPPTGAGLFRARIRAINRATGSSFEKRARRNWLSRRALCMSGREDLNLRPPEPHSGALAKLRHGPMRSSYQDPAPPVKVLHRKRQRGRPRLRPTASLLVHLTVVLTGTHTRRGT